MSNVILNGNTYNDVTSVKLMKADNTGYAEFSEDSGSTDTLADLLVAGGSNIGDYTSTAASPALFWLSQLGGGTISFPNATAANGGISHASFTNILLPNVVSITSHRTAAGTYPAISVFESSRISGMLDLGSLTSIQNFGNSQKVFGTMTVGTLKLGALTAYTQMFYNSTITNLVWNVPSSTAADSNMQTAMNNATAITNLYVPADRVSAIQALVTGGTLTKVTNVYSIADWSDPS